MNRLEKIFARSFIHEFKPVGGPPLPNDEFYMVLARTDGPGNCAVMVPAFLDLDGTWWDQDRQQPLPYTVLGWDDMPSGDDLESIAKALEADL